MKILESALFKALKKLDLLKQRIIRRRFNAPASSYPFNKHYTLINSLLKHGALTIRECEKLKDAYVARNKYLHLFENQSMRHLGINWLYPHLLDLVPGLQKASKKLDTHFKASTYSLYYRDIRIGTGSIRLVDLDSKELAHIKALSYGDCSRFNCSFQHLRPYASSVTVLVAVWRDALQYFVLSSEEIENHPQYIFVKNMAKNGQGQIRLNQDTWDSMTDYEVEPDDLLAAIISADYRNYRHAKSKVVQFRPRRIAKKL